MDGSVNRGLTCPPTPLLLVLSLPIDFLFKLVVFALVWARPGWEGFLQVGEIRVVVRESSMLSGQTSSCL